MGRGRGRDGVRREHVGVREAWYRELRLVGGKARKIEGGAEGSWGSRGRLGRGNGNKDDVEDGRDS